jgi:hypothetical protein
MKKEDVATFIEALAKIKKLMMSRSEYYAQRKTIEDDQGLNWIVRKWRLIKLDWKFKRYKNVSAGVPKAIDIALTDLRPLAQPLFHDLVTTHITPSEDNYVYRRGKLLEEYAQSGKIKPLLTDSDAWSAKDLLPKQEPSAPASFWNSFF